jgi:hypothetical protein
MTTPTANGSTREQLRAALKAVGLDASDARVDELLPAYQGMLSGANRLRALDLGETEPAVVFRLPHPEA